MASSQSRVPLNHLLGIAVGGVLGSLARWGLSLALGKGSFPWPTFIVNVAGSLLLGSLLLWLARHPRSPEWSYRVLGVGFCGGFTTYSAVSLQLHDFITDHQLITGVSYFALSYICSIAPLFLLHTLFKPKQRI